MTLLIAFGSASAQTTDAQDFHRLPVGSVVVLPAGDTLVLGFPAYLVSDSAVARIDFSIQRCEADRAARYRQVELLRGTVDSLEAALRGEQVWRETANALLRRQQPEWQETIENFGLTLGGFAVCRALDGPR